MSTSREEEPRIRKLVLFKHGVAYLERGGPAHGTFELTFKRDEMSDVLKSLAAWVVRGDARVTSVEFEKPEDPEEALRERNLGFAPGQVLTGLILAMRGQPISLTAQGGEAIRGELLGYETTPGPHGAELRTVSIRTAEGQVRIVPLDQVTALEMLADRSRADLAFFLDRSRAATSGQTRTVRIHVRGSAEEMRVSYVIPAPTWRVSYRVASTEHDLTIMGWGIVHNPVDEDVEDAELVLTTGQPVSFMIDLYNPKTVARTVVEESSRRASAPREFAKKRKLAPQAPMRSMAAPMAAFGALGMADTAEFEESVEGASFAGDGGAKDGAAEGVDRGEFFEYRIRDGVSMRRGGSAMVPLFSAKVPARRERIWREGDSPNPDLVLHFTNETGAVLEEGAAVIYDETSYLGEAMVPFSARGSEVRFGYAKDLSVRCAKESKHRSVFTSVRIGEGELLEEYREEQAHTFTVHSDHGQAVTVLCELDRIAGRELAPEHAQPSNITETGYRFAVEAPAHGSKSLTVTEQWRRASRVIWKHVDHARLRQWLDARFLDDATIEKLRAVLALQEKAQELEGKKASWASFRAQQAETAPRISEQLRVLKDSGPEGKLRMRYVEELERAQDQIKEAETAMAMLSRELEKVEAERKQALAAALGSPPRHGGP
jgi:hypothetical protein